MREGKILSKTLLAGFAVVLFASASVAQSTIYVNQSATGVDDGTSWTNAFVSLQDALTASGSGDEIWVAAGTYKADQGKGIVAGEREVSFEIPNGVSLIGGFVGTEQIHEERDWHANPTILSGDLLGNDDDVLSLDNPLRQDNTYQIIRIDGDFVNTTIVDGFTIRGGTANGYGHLHGSALFIRVVTPEDDEDGVFIRNCLITHNLANSATIDLSYNTLPRQSPPVVLASNEIRENSGGGLYVRGGQKTILQDTRIVANSGVPVYGIAGDLYISGSTIADNVSIDQAGINFAGLGSTLYMWNTLVAENRGRDSAVLIGEGDRLVSINNVFTGNTTKHEGGALFLGEARSWIVNNVFSFNHADRRGGAIGTLASNTRISNSIFWHNSAPESPDLASPQASTDTIAVSHTIISQELPPHVSVGAGIGTSDPLFQDADGLDNIPGTVDDDFRLTAFSPAIDAGESDSLLADFIDLDGDGNVAEAWPTDFLGNVRIVDGGSGFSVVDIGAFEYDSFPLGYEMTVRPEASTFLHNSIPLFPNPASSHFTIVWSLPTTRNVHISLYDLSGRRIKRIVRGPLATGDEILVEITGLAQGLYFVRIPSFNLTEKIAIVR